ncbi:MAG TPA: hypothetical protein VME67_08790 [Mycobacterium sp.]|nr:hypothetical protein [Mycobacterium sp.]HTX94928.1 hypothetical protein [Mycobacterium sp.]
MLTNRETTTQNGITVTQVAAELAITRPAARKLLNKYLDVYFGGGFFEGDRKNRLPAKWWRIA